MESLKPPSHVLLKSRTSFGEKNDKLGRATPEEEQRMCEKGPYRETLSLENVCMEREPALSLPGPSGESGKG